MTDEEFEWELFDIDDDIGNFNEDFANIPHDC
jgi:hypothetical protein